MFGQEQTALGGSSSSRSFQVNKLKGEHRENIELPTGSINNNQTRHV
jgi:hypothetical protein